NHALADGMAQKISACLKSLQNKDVGILGLAFKPNTNSVAGSASVALAQSLVSRGARVRAYDPVAIPDAKLELNGTVHYCDSAYASTIFEAYRQAEPAKLAGFSRPYGARSSVPRFPALKRRSY